MPAEPSVIPPHRSPRRTHLQAAARLASWCLVLVVLGLSLLTLAADHWPAELACHFRPQYAVLASLGLFGALAGRAWGAAGVAALALVWQLAVLAPLYGSTGVASGSPCESLRLMSLNIYSDNPQHDLVVAAVRKERPDVVFLLEVTDRWLAALEPLRAEFPYSHAEPRSSNFGMAVYSRRPIDTVRVTDSGNSDYPFLEVDLRVDGRLCTLIGAHPVPPRNRKAWAYRNDQLQFLATRVPRDRPAIVLGDLNITSWSPPFAELLHRTGLRDSRQGFGLQGTWPATLPGARIAIDHALVSREIRVRQRHIGAPVGSDHLPLVVEVQCCADDRHAAPE